MSQLEVLKKKLEKFEANKKADELYTKNLALFKQYLPSLYEAYKEYELSEMCLEFDSSGSVNIKNIKGGFVYSQSPAVFASKQFEEFCNLKPPIIIRYGDTKDQVIDNYHHHQLMKDLLDVYPKKQRRLPLAKKSNYIQTVIVLGIGSGFHIQELVKNKDIKNLVLYDVHMDSLYLSMHFIDWQLIITKYSLPGYNLEICCGKDEDASFRQLSRFFTRVGNYNVSKFYVYDHYNSEKLDGLVHRLKQHAQDIVFGMGFYDDERVGLAHTITSVQAGYPVSRISLTQRKRFCDVPVIIVGNGPSLDLCEAFLRENSAKCLIISCGTSLGTLEKKGIKPDIHVEQERPYNQYVWLNESTTADFRKGIHFYGLNTVHPDVYKLFDEDKVNICVKPNDLGSWYVLESLDSIPGNSISLADGCNPTVTNFGVSLCTMLGLRNIILVGVDLGVSSVEKHHSKDSPYYNGSSIDFEAYIKSQGMFQVLGNFGENVWTTHVYDISRKNIEFMIEKYEFRVANMGEGVFIKGTTPVRPEDVNIDGNGFNKDLLLSDLRGQVFSSVGVTATPMDAIKGRIVKGVSEVNEKISNSLIPGVNTEEEVNAVLRKINFLMDKKTLDPYVFGLLEGTVNYYCSIMSSLCALSEDDEICETYEKARQCILNFIEKQTRDVENRLFELDAYTNYHGWSKVD